MFSGKNWNRFASLAFFVCAIALAGCGKTPETPKADGDPKPAPPNPAPSGPGPGPKQPTPGTPVDLTKEKPVATYTVKEFVAEMIKDRNFPVSKHGGKVIDLTGVVSGYGFGPNAGAFMLETGPNRLFDNRPEKANLSQPWTKALPGQTVTLRALVATSNEMPNPYPWQFIEAKGTPPAAMTAEQLVKEYAADRNAFNKKYENGWVLLTGTVAEVKSKAGEGTEIVLAAGAKEQLLCTIPGAGNAVAVPTASQITALKPGAKVKLLAQPTGDRLTDCVILEPAP